MNHYNERRQKEGETRYQRIRRMREQGLTLAAIGVLEACSRQRVLQILKRGARSI